MLKKIIVGFFLFFSIVVIAQDGDSSPYSFYGIGDKRFRGSVENRSMGSVANIPDSIHFNIQSPATYSSLQRMTFNVAGNHNIRSMKTNSASGTTSRTTFDYLTFAIPTGKLVLAFGLNSLTSVGYKIESIQPQGITDFQRYTGEGGVNRLFLGAGYQLTNTFSLGVDLNYDFGSITTKRDVFKNEVQYGTQELNKSNLSGFNFNIGALYKTKIKRYDFFTSVTFTPETTLESLNERSFSTISWTGVLQETQDAVIDNSSLVTPRKLIFGAGFGDKMSWIVSGEVTMEGTSKLSNLYTDISNTSYENATKFAIGGYFIPNYRSFTSFWDLVTYRAGFRYENTGLIIKDQAINDYALSLGLGIPVGRNFSNVNIGFEYGSRGTKRADLIKENYFNILIGLSISDKWFVRSKYD